MPPSLYTPPDVDVAGEAWGANCGPAALAAVLERPVMELLDAVSSDAPQGSLLGQKHYRGYMGIRDLRRAVIRAGARLGNQRRSFRPLSDEPLRAHPVIVMVRWRGPWDGTRGAAVHRHVVAYRYGAFPLSCALRLLSGDRSQLEAHPEPVGPHWIFDVNAGWSPFAVWKWRVSQWVRPDRATGWEMPWAAEVIVSNAHA